MTDTKMIYTIKKAGTPSYWNDTYATLEEATQKAREEVWEKGHDVAVMASVAIVSAPEMVNTAKVTSLT